MENQRKKINWAEVQRHMLTGISYMIPIIVAAGTIMGFAQITGQIFGFNPGDKELLESSNELLRLIAWISQDVGPSFMGLMYPVLAAFIAYSIGDRPGLAPGFLGGLLASSLGAGFLGAMLIGFLAGYVIIFFNKTIKIKRQYITVKSLFIMPVFGSLIVVLLSRYIVGPIGIGFTKVVTAFMNKIGEIGGAAIAAAIAGGAAFDYGGPVNRVASMVNKQLFFDTNYTYVPNFLGSIIPPIGVGLATIIDKYVVGKRVFDPQLRVNGAPCMILGFLGISEGVIPFAIADPIGTIPITVIGSAVGASLAYLFGCHTFAGVPFGFYGYPLVTNLLAFLFSLLVGVLLVAFGIIFRKNYLYKKQQEQVN